MYAANPVPLATTAVVLIAPLPTLPPKPTILIVDSDFHTRTQTALAFERHGCNALPTATIAEALTLLSREWLGISVVLCDVDLSDGPGETVVVVVRNTARLADARIIMHAIGGAHRLGVGDDDARIAGLMGHGADAYFRQGATWSQIWAMCFIGE